MKRWIKGDKVELPDGTLGTVRQTKADDFVEVRVKTSTGGETVISKFAEVLKGRKDVGE